MSRLDFLYRTHWSTSRPDRKSSLRITAFLFAVSLICSTPLVAQENTDKPLLQTLIKGLQSEDRDERRDAAHALARYGPEAVGAVDELVKALEDRDIQIWGEATQALAHLGSHLGKAVEPALNGLLEYADSSDEQRRYRTAYALGEIGPAAIPALRERTSNDSQRVREVAVRALGWMRSEAADAIPDLVRRLEDEEEIVRQCAIDALGRIGAAATDSLIEALQSDENSELRKEGAAIALSWIGSDASDATEILLKLADDSEPKVRAASISALGTVGRNDIQIVDPLTKAIQSDGQLVHQASLEALVRLHQDLQPEAAKQLAVVLDSSKDAVVLDRIALVLGSYGPYAAEAVPLLLMVSNSYPDLESVSESIGRIGEFALDPTMNALREQQITIEQVNKIVDGLPSHVKTKLAAKIGDPSPLVREVATLTLTKLVPLPADALQSVTQRLSDEHANVRRAAAESLMRMGGKAKPAFDELLAASEQEEVAEAQVAMIRTITALQGDREQLIEFLNDFVADERLEVVAAALGSLGDIPKLPESLHSSLAAASVDTNPDVRRLAIRAIVNTKAKRDQTAQLVVAALKDEDLGVREQALVSVAKLGGAASAALEVISEQLTNEAPRVRIAAVESLSQLGEVAQPAFDDIAKLYEDEDTTVRMTVVKNVRKIEESAQKLLPILIAAVDDSEWEVRQQAAYELGEMEEDAAPAVPALLNMLRKNDDSDAARRALREINTAGDEAIPVLLEIIKDESAGRRPRYYALYLLRKMGSRAKSVLPELRELAEKAEGRYREYYERAIEEISEDEDDE